jgi:1-deoxy-D-xylulose-5-phosphate reductoisomerase
MVEFIDGSVLAQCSPPNMKLPIALGMTWPQRLANIAPACDWSRAASWTFEPLDESVFKSVAIARRVGAAGLTYPAVYNAANEQAVDAFHARKIRFDQITDIIEKVVDAHAPETELSLESVLHAERWARDRADGIMSRAC